MQSGHGEKLSRSQEKAIAGLLTQPTIKEAAKSAGIGNRTLIGWLKNEPSFIASYRQARREVVRAAIAGIQGAMHEAVEALRDVLNDSDAPASARVSAARVILDSGLRGAELEDLETRIEALEKEITGK